MKRTKFPVKRTKLPARRNNEIKKRSYDEITKELTNTEKADLLICETNIANYQIGIKKNVFNVGRELHRAKEILKHGDFRDWIKCRWNEDLPYSTAYFYMRVFEVFKDCPNLIQLIPTKQLLMVTNKKFPEEILKAIKDNPDKVDKAVLMQLDEDFQLFKNGTIGSSQFIKIAEEQIKLGANIIWGREKHRLNTNMRRSYHLGASDILTRINELRTLAQKFAGIYPFDPNNIEHKQLISLIDKTIEGLQLLKKDIEGGDGFFREISSPEGDLVA